MALAVSHEAARKLVRRDVKELAPLLRAAVKSAIAGCEKAGYPVHVYECLRTDELARMYFQLGASKAKNGYGTWHFYGLGIDIVHPVYGWAWWDLAALSLTEAKKQGHEEAAWRRARVWQQNVVRIFKRNGMDWGGDWISFKDWPHFTWERCKPSPSGESVRLYEAAGGGQPGREAVWRAVQAI